MVAPLTEGPSARVRFTRFAAAARRLRRTQSSVGETMASLEAQLAVTLFDRSARYPRLTTEGEVLLADAHAPSSLASIA